MRNYTIIIFLSLISINTNGQVFNPFDLFISSEIARTDSYVLMQYFLRTNDKSNFKFIERIDSGSVNKSIYSIYKFSNGKDQNISFCYQHDFSTEIISGWVQYELLNERLFDEFKDKLLLAKLDLISSDKTVQGTPFWMWGYSKQSNAEIYLRLKMVTIFKEKWGYRIDIY